MAISHQESRWDRQALADQSQARQTRRSIRLSIYAVRQKLVCHQLSPLAARTLACLGGQRPAIGLSGHSMQSAREKIGMLVEEKGEPRFVISNHMRYNHGSREQSKAVREEVSG